MRQENRPAQAPQNQLEPTGRQSWHRPTWRQVEVRETETTFLGANTDIVFS